MKKISLFLILFFVFIDNTYAYFYTSDVNTNSFKTKNYSYIINLNGGVLNGDINIKNGVVILPAVNRSGYSFVGWSNNGDNYSATWIDDIPPVITRFDVQILGLYNESLGYSAGVNLKIYVEGYDLGSGISKYQTVLLPYNKGSGGTRKDGSERYMTNVLYLDEAVGRNFCAYIIDNAGNETHQCKNVRI